MCGITIYLSKENQDDNKISAISHRGPDMTIIHKFKWFDYNLTLGFHRLAIIDIKHGDQPFIYKDEKSDRKIYLLCNGEIYNYKFLIDRYNLDTKSDCHVILDLYLDFGIEQTVKKLDGEFAFVLIDIEKDEINIYACRDRFGIRPLFYYTENSNHYFSSELKGLPFDGLGEQIHPRHIYHFNGDQIDRSATNSIDHFDTTPYYVIGENIKNLRDSYLNKISSTLIDSVEDRMVSEREIGALLSGGLDSSLICGIAAKKLKKNGERLHTFSIGIEKDAPDIKYARLVADYINSIHHEIIIPIEEWLQTIPDLVKQIETYDITTIRASMGQYLISKWIKENTNIKVLLVGDGSDELASGYKYFYNTPNIEESHNENLELLNNIHLYDVLRCDRGISAWGLEARVPFLSHEFVDMYLSINKQLRMPIKNKMIEKFLLRKSFDQDKLSIIPLEVLYRSKEAFSDGVSNIEKSWYEYIQEFVDKIVYDDEFEDFGKGFPSKEAYWYYKLFKEFYPKSELKVKYWMPKWTEEHGGDPSARKLKSVY
jgi:asparagine synthase (glutamine-hydrolysing)